LGFSFNLRRYTMSASALHPFYTAPLSTAVTLGPGKYAAGTGGKDGITIFSVHKAGGVIENKHSTDVNSYKV
jgi:hypothetical protein